jgi:hypothetical protein
MTQEAHVMPVTCSLNSESAAVFMDAPGVVRCGHRQGSNDGKVNTRR